MNATAGSPHLHVASAYSVHYGVTMPGVLVDQAAAQGDSFLALTDRDGLYGAVKHVRACLAAGIPPGLGADLAVHDDASRPLGRVVVLAQEHLTVLLGPATDVGQSLESGDGTDSSARLAEWLRLMPRRSIALEVVFHPTEAGRQCSPAAAARMLALAGHAGLPAVLTNAVRYGTPHAAATADLADSARLLTPLDRLGQPPEHGQAWLKPGPLMHRVARRPP